MAGMQMGNNWIWGLTWLPDPKSSGKLYFEIQNCAFDGWDGNPQLPEYSGGASGPANFSLVPIFSEYAGLLNLASLDPTYTLDRYGYVNGTDYGLPGLLNQTLCGAIDMDNLRFWYRINNGTWNPKQSGANPTTNTGGYSLASGKQWVPGYRSILGNGLFLIVPDAAHFLFTVPSGFSPWSATAPSTSTARGTFSGLAAMGQAAATGRVTSSGVEVFETGNANVRGSLAVAEVATQKVAGAFISQSFVEVLHSVQGVYQKPVRTSVIFGA